MRHKRNGIHYSDKLCQLIVDLYHSHQKVKDLSSLYGVSDVTIHLWVKKLTHVGHEDGSSITLENYAKLQEQIEKLKEENEILLALEHSQIVRDSLITEYI